MTAPDGGSRRNGRRAARAGAWALATGLLALCFRGADWPAVAELLVRAHPGWIAAAVLANASIVLLWAAQWRLFLPRDRAVAFPRVLRITAIMAMVANSVPFLAGQATGLHLLATRGGTGHAAALSVAALDQLAEGLAKVALLLALATVAPLPPALARAAVALAAAVALLLGVVLAAAWSHRRIPLPAARGPFAVVMRFVAEWARGLEGARRPWLLAGGVGLSLAMKGAELCGILAAQSALGVDLPAWSALPVLAATALSTMVSVAPANLGVYEGSAFLAYRALGVAPEAAVGLAVLQHLAYLAPMAGGGWLALTAGSRRRRAVAGASD